MNIITGCLSATEGRISVGGHDILEEPEAAKRLIGYLPEQPPLYMNETPLEYLRFVGEAKGVRGAELKRQIETVVEQTGIGSVKNRLISALSKGYKQRVGIAQALLGNPQVIILDEPTVGLDPIQIIEIRELIRRLGETHTVIFSSHILSEVQAICEQVVIISKGRLVAFDTPENLEKLLTQSREIRFAVQAAPEETEEVLQRIEGIQKWECTDGEDGSVSVHAVAGELEAREAGCRIFRAFAEAGLPIFEMIPGKASLEEVFVEMTEDASEDGEREAQTGDKKIKEQDKKIKEQDKEIKGQDKEIKEQEKETKEQEKETKAEDKEEEK